MFSATQADTVSTDAMESYLGELVGQEMPALVAAWAFWAESLGLEPPECADARHCFWRRQKRDDGLGWEFPPYVATEEEMAGFGNVSGKWGSHVPELEGHSVQTPLEALGQTPPEAETLPLGARVGALAGLGYGAAAGVGLFLAIGAAVVIAVPRRRQRTAPGAPCSAAAFST